MIIAHRNNLIIDEVELLEPDSPHHDQIVWARLSVRNSNPIYTGSYCRSNSKNNKETISGLKSSLQDITNLTRNNPRVTVVLGGDFNARGIDWDNNTAKPGVEHRPLCESILETLSEHLSRTATKVTYQERLYTRPLLHKQARRLVKSICNIPGFSSKDHEFLVVDIAGLNLKCSKNTKEISLNLTGQVWERTLRAGRMIGWRVGLREQLRRATLQLL